MCSVSSQMFDRLLHPLLHYFTHVDSRVEVPEEVETERSSPSSGLLSPVMDRNPSPPPDTADGEEDGGLDAIGDTVYSKHWLFSTLTRLINVGSCFYSQNPEPLKVQSCFKVNLSYCSCLWACIYIKANESDFFGGVGKEMGKQCT